MTTNAELGAYVRGALDAAACAGTLTMNARQTMLNMVIKQYAENHGGVVPFATEAPPEMAPPMVAAPMVAAPMAGGTE